RNATAFHPPSSGRGLFQKGRIAWIKFPGIPRMQGNLRPEFFSNRPGVPLKRGCTFAAPGETAIPCTVLEISRSEILGEARLHRAFPQKDVPEQAAGSCRPGSARQGATGCRSKKRTPIPLRFPARPSTSGFHCWRPYGSAQYPATIASPDSAVRFAALQNLLRTRSRDRYAP